MRPVVTEQTAKKYKAARAFGALLMIVGVVLAGPAAMYGLAALLFGLVLYLYGRIGAWWNHD